MSSNKIESPQFITEIWLVHAGCGKTTAASRRDDVLDMTIGEFKYLHPLKCESACDSEKIKATGGDLNPAWPNNYIKAIASERNSGRYRFILAPVVHSMARALENASIPSEASPIPYTLVYPQKSLKDEYRERYKLRGNNDAFLNIFIEEGSWEQWLDSFEKLNPAKRILLGTGEFLQDVLP